MVATAELKMVSQSPHCIVGLVVGSEAETVAARFKALFVKVVWTAPVLDAGLERSLR